MRPGIDLSLTKDQVEALDALGPTRSAATEDVLKRGLPKALPELADEVPVKGTYGMNRSIRVNVEQAVIDALKSVPGHTASAVARRAVDRGLPEARRSRTRERERLDRLALA